MGVIMPMTYSWAVEVKSLRGINKQKDRILIWLAHVNNLLPYELHLSDTEVELLAKILSELLEKKMIE